MLGHNSGTALSPIFDLNMADPTTVFTGTLFVPGGLKAGDWVTIPVSGFTYYPAWNLVVDVSQYSGTTINLISATNADVPGASGWMSGPIESPAATDGDFGQCDFRVYLSK